MQATVSQTQVPPHLDIDPYAVQNLLDPYPFHRALRDTAAVVWLPQYEVYAVGRHADVKAVMSDYQRFSSIAGIGLIDKRDPESEKFRKTSPMTEADPPVHTKTRAGMQKLLSPVVVRGWRERYEQVAARIVDRVAAIDGPFDAVPELAEDMVYTVIPESLGLDVPREHLPGIGEMNFFSLGPMNELRRESSRGSRTRWPTTTARPNARTSSRAAFGDTIYQAEDAGVFEPGIGIGLVRTFLRGGTDTSIAAISSLLMLAAETSPALPATCMSNPSTAPGSSRPRRANPKCWNTLRRRAWRTAGFAARSSCAKFEGLTVRVADPQL